MAPDHNLLSRYRLLSTERRSILWTTASEDSKPAAKSLHQMNAARLCCVTMLVAVSGAEEWSSVLIVAAATTAKRWSQLRQASVHVAVRPRMGVERSFARGGQMFRGPNCASREGIFCDPRRFLGLFKWLTFKLQYLAYLLAFESAGQRMNYFLF